MKIDPLKFSVKAKGPGALVLAIALGSLGAWDFSAQANEGVPEVAHEAQAPAVPALPAGMEDLVVEPIEGDGVDVNGVETAALEVGEEVPAADDEEAAAESEYEEYVEEDAKPRSLSMNYFGILYGPALRDSSSFQPTFDGTHDPERPILLKNFFGVGFNFTDTINLSANANWLYIPVHGQRMEMRDPFIRLSDSSIINVDTFNLYSDVRVHFPITEFSRQNDMYAGFQTSQIATYTVGTSRLTLGLYGSARVNVFGPQGFGNDLELYAGPNLAYQLLPNFALTLLYEMGASHIYGAKPFEFVNDGTDLEPGFQWDITPNFMINPYLNLYPGNRLTLSTTSLGMLISWKIM